MQFVDFLRVVALAVTMRYRLTGKKIDIRRNPSIEKSGCDPRYLCTGEVFEATDFVDGADGRRYFKLADGRGWVYDRSAKDQQYRRDTTPDHFVIRIPNSYVERIHAGYIMQHG